MHEEGNFGSDKIIFLLFIGTV